MRHSVWNLYLFGALLVAVSCAPRVRLGIVGGTDGWDAEETALAELLSSRKGVTCREIALDEPLRGIDVVWYHRCDTGAVTNQELAAGKNVKEYVGRGGRLILSKDAVKLLNAWGIEPTPLSTMYYDAVDEGFGRKAGFHGFRSHPLFDGLHGGAYVWHGHADNRNRYLGFDDGAVPTGPDARVIGIFWEYIYYRPERKVIWEETLGKGKILAVGGLLNYGRENYNEEILNRFTFNCIDYLTGRGKGEAFCWDYSVRGAFEDDFSSPSIALSEPEAWTLPETDLSRKWLSNAAEVTVPSRRSMVISRGNGGIFEIWTHPFMSLRDYEVYAETADGIFKLEAPETPITLRPEAVVREFSSGPLHVCEIITTEVDRPATVAHYEWTGVDIRSLQVRFRMNFRYMWPYDAADLGSVRYGWSEGQNAFVATTEDGAFVSMVGSNVPGSLKEVSVDPAPLQLTVSATFNTDGKKACDIVLAAGNEGLEKAQEAYQKAVSDPEAVLHRGAEYYRSYLAGHVQVETPDPVFNEGYRWAVLGSGQFVAATPGVGTGLMAGYASSRRGWGGGQPVSGRPGYAWYFGRDSEWASLAFLDMGDLEAVRDNLELLMKYQRVDGKIYHELTTSGSVHYDASDATPFFVVLMGKYLRASGDKEFIRDHMDNIRRAMDFCASTDTNGDRLPENINVGHGWLEGGDFFGNRTEFVVAGLWEKALGEASYMCKALGLKKEADAYSEERAVISDILNNDFWKGEKGWYSYGKRDDGTFAEELLVLVNSIILMGDTDPEKSVSTVEKFSSLHFHKDWGTAQVADTTYLSRHGAYSEDNVWPLHTGTLSLAEYKTGLYNQGFTNLMGNLTAALGGFHGRVPEVIHADGFRPTGITLFQCWSETMVVQPVIEGMLGFSPDALGRGMTIAPRLPADWNTIRVDQLAVGGIHAGFEMEKTMGRIVYRFHSDGPLQIAFRSAFNIGTVVKGLSVNGAKTDFSTASDGAYVTMDTAFDLNGEAEVEIVLEEGPAPLPAWKLAEDGGPSTGLVILGHRLEGGKLIVTVQGHAGTADELRIYDPSGEVRTVSVDFPAGPSPYVTRELVF